MGTSKTVALKRTALFGGLEDSELEALAGRAIERRLSRGEVLFVAGEEAAGLYVIVKGAVKAYRESVEGREQIIHVERAGATLAEVPVFDGGVYPSSASAEEDSILLFISRSDVRQLLLDRPQLALAALKLMAGRLRRCAELAEALSLQDVDQRLARLLLDIAQTSGTPTDAGLLIELSLTNQQIAAHIGSVREVVSRGLSRLQQNNLIRVEGRNVTIVDPEALRSFISR